MKKILVLLLTTTFLVACSSNDLEEEKSEENTEEVTEELEKEKTTDSGEKEDEEEAKVFIQEGPEEITIRSENIGISNLSLVSLDYDPEKDELLEKEILKEKENIKEDEKTTWEVIYSEGIPSMKIVWELSNGEEGEYLILYDGKDGLDEKERMIYPEENNN